MNSVDFVTLTKFQLEKVKYRGEIFQSEQSRREHVKGWLRQGVLSDLI